MLNLTYVYSFTIFLTVGLHKTHFFVALYIRVVCCWDYGTVVEITVLFFKDPVV